MLKDLNFTPKMVYKISGQVSNFYHKVYNACAVKYNQLILWNQAAPFTEQLF